MNKRNLRRIRFDELQELIINQSGGKKNKGTGGDRVAGQIEEAQKEGYVWKL